MKPFYETMISGRRCVAALDDGVPVVAVYETRRQAVKAPLDGSCVIERAKGSKGTGYYVCRADDLEPLVPLIGFDEDSMMQFIRAFGVCPKGHEGAVSFADSKAGKALAEKDVPRAPGI